MLSAADEPARKAAVIGHTGAGDYASPAVRLFDSSDNAHPDSSLAAYSCVVSLLPPGQEAA